MRGGHNQTHGTLERYPRVDSFRLNSRSGWVTINKSPVRVTTMPNNYGGARAFFLCPHCGRRVRFVYGRSGRWLCRRCAKLNYASQQRGHDEMEYYERAVKILRGPLQVPREKIPAPIDLPDFIPVKPRGMHWDTYERHMAQVRELGRLYEASWIAIACRKLPHLPPPSGWG